MSGLGSSRFRESAIVRNAQPEPLDDRAQLTAPREWGVLVCFGLVVAAIIVWGVFGSVERTFRSDGALVLSGERRTVPSAASGTVAEVLVSAGQRVAAGQAIARVSLAETERQVRLAAASASLLEDDAKSAAGGGRAGAERVPALVQALLGELAALREASEIVSPGDGVIAATFVAPGKTIPVGAPVADIVIGDASKLDAVAFVEPEDSWRLASGMTARVIIESADGHQSIPGKLAAIAPGAAKPPGWLTRMHPNAAARGRGHVLRFAVEDIPGLTSPAASPAGGSLEDGMPCRIEVVLERTSPFHLLIRS